METLRFTIYHLLIVQVEAIQTEVTKQQQETEEDLTKAEPALQAANTALNTLNRVKCFNTHETPHAVFD